MSRLKRLSLKTRISLAATSLLLLVLIVAVLALTGLEKRSLVHEIDLSLNDRIYGLIEMASAGDLPRDVPLTGRETGVVQIFDKNNKVLASTPGLGSVGLLNKFRAPQFKPDHRTVLLALDRPTAVPWRIAAQRVRTNESFVYIYAATNLEPVDNTIDRLRATLLVGTPLLVAAFGAISWFTTRSALAPVERLSETVDAMENLEELHQLPEIDGHDELARLVRTANALLVRASGARRRERRFAADASHELRTPITTARLNLEIAAANPTRENLLQSVHDTLVEVGRLEVLARDLLELTRLDPERVVKNAVEFNVSELFAAEVALRRKRHPEFSYEFHAPDSATIWGVSFLVSRVIRNLLDNAERHTAAFVEIRVNNGAKWVTTLVHNNGDSIAIADRVRIFEPFTRLDEARNRNDGGSGLGLAIASDIVHAHGGRIAVVDDLRGGTTFQFTLPTQS